MEFGKLNKLTFLVVVVWCGAGFALDNGLGKTPGLGWNSDYCVNCTNGSAWGNDGLGGFENEEFIKHIADYMHSHVLPCGKTMQQLGFEYVNIDGRWDLPNRDASGNLVPNPVLWPSGIDTTINYVHSLGLKFGLYGDRGIMDCGRNPGALGHEKSDANFMARNKVDWYKEDNCYSSGDKYKQYGTMRDALNSTGYPIWFALCGWSTDDASNPAAGYGLANSARIGPDTGTGWTAVMKNIEGGLATTQFSGPKGSGGFWLDGSLMLTPGMGHDDVDHMTNERHRSQFNAWAIMGMNILTTGNLSALNSYVMDTWTNVEVLAVNQDPKGYAATQISTKDVIIERSVALSATMSPPANVQECGGEPALQQWSFNSPANGYLRNNKSNICLNVQGCKSNVIYDGCLTGPQPTCDGHGSEHPNLEWTFLCSGGGISGSCQIQSALPGHPCLTVKQDGSVDVATCSGVPLNTQTWTLNPTTRTLTTSTGLCLTASANAPPGPPPANETIIVIGRRLTSGAAILFLNNGLTDVTITCGAPCLQQMNITKPVTVRDLWMHADVDAATTSPTMMTTTTTATTPVMSFNTTVAAGDSRMFSLMPSSQAQQQQQQQHRQQ